MKKIVVVLLLVALLGALGRQIYVKVEEARKKEQNATTRHTAPPVAVEVAAVTKAEVRDVATFTGSLQPESYFVVAPKVAGRLVKLNVNIGDRVERGQLLAVLDDEEYRQQVVQMQAELEVQQAMVEEAKSDLEIGQREYERMQSMREKNIASEAQFDSARSSYLGKEAALNVAKAWIAQKRAALEAAKIRLSYTRIHVSWEEGSQTRLVGQKFVDEGAMLRANDEIVSVMDISTLTAVVYIIERDYSKVAVGQEALITTDAYPDDSFTGKVLRIAPLLKENIRQARVELKIPNPDGRLKPGMFVRVAIELARHPDATVVPYAALVRREGRDGVFLAESGKAGFVPVKLGIVDREQAEILAPNIGSVITIGQHLLTDGADISVTRSDAAVDTGGTP